MSRKNLRRFDGEILSKLFAPLVFVPLSLLLAGCTVDIVGGLTEPEAQEIIVVLKQNGIDADKKLIKTAQAESWTVVVPSSDASLAWAVLVENDLPRQKNKGFEEIVKKESLIPTQLEEKSKFLHALSGELERTLESIGGIVSARVHVVIPENNPLRPEGEQQPKAKASVLLKYRGSSRPVDEEEVKKLVANGVEGLSKDNVEVIMKPVAQVTPREISKGRLDWLRRFMSGILAVLSTALSVMLIFAVFKIRQLRQAVYQLQQQNASLTKQSSQ